MTVFVSHLAIYLDIELNGNTRGCLESGVQSDVEFSGAVAIELVQSNDQQCVCVFVCVFVCVCSIEDNVCSIK